MSSRGGVVSKMGTENFNEFTVSAISRDRLIQTGRKAYQIVGFTGTYSVKVLDHRSAGYRRTCEPCTEKPSGFIPMTATH
jgi:hypothetical protein